MLPAVLEEHALSLLEAERKVKGGERKLLFLSS